MSNSSPGASGRTENMAQCRCLHIAAVLSADGEEGFRNLTQGADADGFHELGKDVFIAHDGLLQRCQHGSALGGVAPVEIGEALEL